MAKTIYLKDYKPSPYLIDKTALHFELDPTATLVHGTFHIQTNPKSSEKNAPLVLDGEHLELVSLKRNGETLTDFEKTDHSLSIPDVASGDVIEITTRINPEANKALEGLYISNQLFCTQCEPEGFRRIIYYLDRPDVMSSFTVRIEADKTQYPILLSNGNLTDKGDLTDGKHYAVFEDPFKKPCYLFALVAGTLDCLSDTFTTCSGKTVDLHIFVEPGKKDKTHHAMAAIKKSMLWDEKHYGREYDLNVFSIVAVSDFVAGAMENKSLNIFNDKYILVDSQTATDMDYQNVDRVVAHEYFHNWTGDRITCRDWFDLCLKEGLTVYREQSFMQDDTDPITARIDEVITLTDRQFKEDASPLAHPVRPEAYQQISNFYTATVYEKGSEVFRMLANLVGKAGFRKATDLYFDRFDSQAVTIEDFVNVVEETNEIDLSEFKRWYSQSGTPIVTATSNYDNNTFSITLSQETKPTTAQQEKHPLHIPVAMGLLDASGNELLPTQMLNLTQASQTFTFDNIATKPIPSLLRYFTSPVKCHYEYAMAELSVLALHDSDHFNRWSAMQRLFNKVLVALVANDESHLPELLSVTAQLLENNDMSKRALARCLSLPSDTVILDQFDVIDLDRILSAKEQLISAIAHHNQTAFRRLFDENNTAAEYAYEKADINQRFLKNICLYYLATTAQADDLRLVEQQFSQANNMTDELAVLSALNNVDCPQRKTIFQQFYDKWQSEHLVVNKWLAMEAASALPAAFSTIKAIEKQNCFNIKNPNKVYALLVQFGTNNLKGFHDPSGQAYQYMAEKVVEIDGFNPQVAGRLMNVFSSWRQFDKNRQTLMQQALQSIADTAELSSNVREMVERMLA